jgi:hypothetical protein
MNMPSHSNLKTIVFIGRAALDKNGVLQKQIRPSHGTVKKTLPIIGQIIPEKRESRFGYFYYRKKWQLRLPLIGNLYIRTVGTQSIRTPERTLWENSVFARRKSIQIFIRFE